MDHPNLFSGDFDAPPEEGDPYADTHLPVQPDAHFGVRIYCDHDGYAIRYESFLGIP